MMTCKSANEPNKNGEAEAKFSAVTDGSQEAEEFFAATPYGELELGVMNAQHFEVGKDYYIDITPVE